MAEAYRYEVVLLHEGDVLDRQEASVAPALEDAILHGVLCGDVANDGSVPPAIAEPRWADGGSPRVARIDVRVGAGPERSYDTDVFAQRARAMIRRLLIDGKVSEDAIVKWEIEAAPRPKSRFARVGGTRRPLPLTMATLPETERGTIEVRVHEDLLLDLDRQVQATPLLEVAGLVAGRMLHDPARGACAVELARYFPLPAGDAGSSGSHFDFGSRTFRAMRRTVDALEDGYACTGWAHSHPACEACKDHPECPTQTVFFSEDDIAVHASSFGAPYQVGLVAGKLADRPVTDPGVLAFGWRRAVVEGVTFRIVRGHGQDTTLTGTLTRASLIEPIDVQIEDAQIENTTVDYTPAPKAAAES
ncbi:MAG: hypothetical protein V3R77_00600 [Candidatus Binatia bacterium]